MTEAQILRDGRDAFLRSAWTDAFALLSDAASQSTLSPPDIERLATAAYLTGRDEAWAGAMSRAHNAWVAHGDAERAARCAFWLALGSMQRGDMAQAGGWLVRAHRLLDEGRRDCAESGYLLVPAGLQAMESGDFGASEAIFRGVIQTGDRFKDHDLLAFGRLGCGEALLRQGRVGEGVALHDDVMVAATTGELSPIVVGLVYCAVIEACQQIFDLRRAQEWTEALSRWCDAQPDLVPYRGECLVRRSELMQLHGAWREADEEAQRACRLLARVHGQAPLGAAFYQQAELHRLRGDFARAEESYLQASRCGRTPEPGLAQLRLAQGRVDAAVASIRRALAENQERTARARLLAAAIEILLSSGDVEAARAAAEELSRIATALEAPYLQAVAALAQGAVLLAAGDARGALPHLRAAWLAYEQLEAPYEVAKTRVHIALACRDLGDGDTAQMELQLARAVFQELGAAPDVARLEVLAGDRPALDAGGLTPRELEILRLLAGGRSNRAIANELVISEKTVARHVSNILMKLQLPSRSAATAYAYEHGIVARST